MQGIVCSGITYYIQGVVMKERGPVFVTAFSPLSMVLVTILGSFILSEIIFLGRCALIFLCEKVQVIIMATQNL